MAEQNKTKQSKANTASGRTSSFESGKKPGKVTLQTLFVVLYWLCGIKQGEEILPAFAGGRSCCFFKWVELPLVEEAGRELRLLLAHAARAGRKLRLLLAHAAWMG
jgi:hypothetical protein